MATDIGRPRIEGLIFLQTDPKLKADGVILSKITVQLKQCEETTLPSGPLSLSHSSRPSLINSIGDELVVWTPKTQSLKVTAMTVPFVYMLPSTVDEVSGISATMSLPHLASCKTYYELHICAFHPSGRFATATKAVTIDRYDTLSSWGMFNVPRTFTMKGQDHIVEMTISLPHTACGPCDMVPLFLQLLPNIDWPAKSSKVRVKTISIITEQIIAFKSTTKGKDEILKQETVTHDVIDMANIKIPSKGLTREILIDYPGIRNRNDVGTLSVDKREYALTTGFTTYSNMYSITFQIVVKASLHKAKNITITMPLTVCPFNRAETDKLLIKIERSVDLIKMKNSSAPATVSPFPTLQSFSHLETCRKRVAAAYPSICAAASVTGDALKGRRGPILGI